MIYICFKIKTEPLYYFQENKLKDECFTSKQYSLFLQKYAAFLKTQGSNIDPAELELMMSDIEKLKELEAKLIKNNQLFINYKKIQETYPDTVYKNVTVQHLTRIIEDNKQIVDEYGNVNVKVIALIQDTEKYLKVKDKIDELNKLSQSGGGSAPKNFFAKFNDKEFFVTDEFKDVLERIKKLPR